MESQPGSSKDDPCKPRAKKSKLSRESNPGGKDFLGLSKQNSPGLFHRVTNSVSGLLSNVSWSDWLNNSIAKNGNETKISEEKPAHNINSSAPLNSQFIMDETQLNKKKLNPLYPEEGILDANGSKVDSRFLDVSKSENNFATAMEYSCFEKARPIYSSTPSISLLSGNKNKKIERIRGEGISPIPSTSGACSEASIFIENSLGLLRKSLYNSQEDSTFPYLNGSLSASASKKRLLDQNYATEESEVRESVDEIKLHSALPIKESYEAPLKKRPRFSISSFGSPLFDKPDLLTCKQDLNDSSLSVFYPGKITYGGAYNRHATRLTNRKAIPRTNLTSNVSSTKEFEDGGLSTAAKRILNCIDKISTPLSNSKRIYFSKQREPDSPSYVADFHKHRPSLKSSGEISSPPVAYLLTPGKAKVNRIHSTMVKNAMAANKNSVVKEADSHQSINSSSFIAGSPAKKVVSEWPINSNLNKSPFPSKPVYEVPQLDRSKEIPEKNELISSEPHQPQIKQSISTRDSILKDKQEPSVKNNGLFSFSMPIPFAAPSNISKELNNSKSLKFTFRSPIKVDALPERTIPPVSKNGFGDSFKTPTGSWECGTCLIQNKESASCCIACTSPKPSNNSAKISSTEVITKITENNWGQAFLPSKGLWDCDVCLLQNKESVTKCVACETVRPSSKNDFSREKKNVESPNVVSNLLPYQSTDGMWECQTCLIKNINSVEKCIACNNSKSSLEKEINNWGEKFKPSKGTWDCDICLLQNSATVNSCVACQTLRPGKDGNSLQQTAFSSIEKSSDSSVFEKPTSNFKFGCGSSVPFSSTSGSESGKSQDEWQCETCLVRNKLSSNKCISCEAPRNKISSSSLVSEAMTGNFKFSSAFSNVNNSPLGSTSNFPAKSTSGESNSFGNFSFKGSDGFKSNSISCEASKTQNVAPTFSFGLKNANEKIDSSNISMPSFSTSNTTSSSQPIIAPITKNPEVKSTSENQFLMGITSSEKSKILSFSFGSSNEIVKGNDNTDNEKTTEKLKTVPANVGDKEHNGKKEDVDVCAKKVDSNKSLNSGIFEGTKNPLDSKHSSLSKAEPNKPASATFSFGSIPKSTNDSSQISKTDLNNKNLFTFGTTPKTDFGSTSVFSFGSSISKDPKEATSTKNAGSTSSPAFTFKPTLSKDSNEVQPKGTSVPVFSFGSTLSKDSSKEPQTLATCQPKEAGLPSTPAFSFGPTLSRNSNEATSTGANNETKEISTPIFSFNSAISKDSKETASAGSAFQPPKFTFGQNDSSDKEKLPNSSSLFSFGESNPKPLNATFSFGNSPAVVAKDAPKFSFGDSGASSGLTFGTTAANAKPASNPTFSFGGNQTLKSNFNFGGASTTSFSFGKPSEPSTNPSSIFQFGNENKLGDSSKTIPEPSFGGLETNPFNVLSTPSVASSKRVIRKAVRRNK